MSEIKNETENDISVMYDELDGIDGLGDYDQSMEEEKESEGEFECDHCEFRTTEARYLKYHKQSSHEVGRFKCEECDYLAHKPYMMKSHMTNKHNKVKIEYLCERENMDIKHYVCQHCHYLNTDKSKLESHMERKHINDPNENVVQKKTKKSKKGW